MRKQLRPFYTPKQYAQLYSQIYNHSKWDAHVERVNKTIEVLDRFAHTTYSESVADLSCGDGAVINNSRHPWQKKIIGDYATTGPIEEAVRTMDSVDMFVLSETLEHIEDPDTLLLQIRESASHLVLTTPCNETNNENPQHYWGWDTEGVAIMLGNADFNSTHCELFTPNSNNYYTFQIWTCS